VYNKIDKNIFSHPILTWKSSDTDPEDKTFVWASKMTLKPFETPACDTGSLALVYHFGGVVDLEKNSVEFRYKNSQ